MNILLKENLKKSGLKEKEIVSDNNCQFHAIIDQCLQNGITGWDHKKLRISAVQWLKENKETKMEDIKIKELFDINENKIIQLQQYNNVWGDESTLFAISQILNAQIRLYSSIRLGEILYINPINKEHKYIFHLGYYQNIHYVSTIPSPVSILSSNEDN